MEIFSPEFMSALLAIVVIDLVLAGDNAIVIALAARNVPKHLQKRAIMWGTVGAIAVRSSLTMVVVWLLKVPGLMLAGGAMLIWIAYRLLVPANEGGEHNVAPASTFWGAMKTIIVADALMGLDNVLAVAGAAHGSFLLVVLGLLISIPIVIWGSQLILKYVERFPAIIYFGAGVLEHARAVAAEVDGALALALHRQSKPSGRLRVSMPADFAHNVASGMLWMLVLMWQLSKKGLTPVVAKRLNCLSLFWHFLDVVWIGVFTVVYLMGAM